MKKLILSTTLALTLTVGTSVSANTEENTTNAGTTPDQFSYFFDQLWEDLKLTFTFNSEEEAKLLVEFAKERLAEAQLMTEEEKKEYVQDLVEDYLTLLEQAQEKVSDAMAEEDLKDEEKEKLSDELEEATEINEEIEEQLEDEVKEEVTQIQDKAYLVANVVMGYDTEQVKLLREQGFGYGEIAKIISLSDITGKTVEEIAALLEGEEADLEAWMAEMGISMAEIKESAVSKKMTHVEAALAEAVEAEDANAIKKLTKKLDVLKKKQEKFAAKIEPVEEEEAVEDTGEATEEEEAAEEQPEVVEETEVVEAPEAPEEDGTESEENAGTVTPAVAQKNKEQAKQNKERAQEQKEEAKKKEEKASHKEQEKEDKNNDKASEKQGNRKNNEENENEAEEDGNGENKGKDNKGNGKGKDGRG